VAGAATIPTLLRNLIRAGAGRGTRGEVGMTSSWRTSVVVALATLAGAAGASAQQGPLPGPPPAQVPAAPPNSACARLEGQLSAIDRGAVDPARADQIKRTQDATDKQQADLDRMSAQARQLGCQGGGFFSLFSGQNPQCTPLNQRIQQSRANLEKMLADLDRMQGGAAGDREAQRATVIGALAQNNCGPQYRAAANQQRGFFDTLFGGNRSSGGGGGGAGGLFSSDAPSGTYRTVCVRTCDGYYFPISYATTPDKFAEDAQTCQQTCPASEVVLMSHRNPGEDINQAVTTSGAPYTSLANAFKYRTAVVQACSCRQPGQSWAQALGQVKDGTLQGDDIVVTPERSKSLAAPRDAQGRLLKQDVKTLDPKAASAAAAAAEASAPSNEGDTTAPTDKKKQIRAVGPTFVPPGR
jgi:hypothetical protein